LRGLPHCRAARRCADQSELAAERPVLFRLPGTSSLPCRRSRQTICQAGENYGVMGDNGEKSPRHRQVG
jgi:hypothetical protein